jgi:membrane-bound lytic murein transglycosylase A
MRPAGAFLRAAGLAFMLLAVGCQAPPKPPGPPESPLVRLEPAEYPEFTDDLKFEGLEAAIAQSLAYLQRVPPERELQFGPDRYTADHLRRSLVRLGDIVRLRPDGAELRRRVGSEFRVYRSVGRDGKGEVLFTGYYEPLLEASLSPSAEYPHPIYGRPSDLLTIDLGSFGDKYKGERLVGRVQQNAVVPYYDRREIEEAGALRERAVPLAWARDLVDVYFLQVQGSGRLVLDHGETRSVGYDTANGRPYRSIGRLLIDEGKMTLEESSMQRIRDHLARNPAEVRRILNTNPSYVFFRFTPDGPLGNLNVPVTPGRSIALDRKLFPPAAPAFVQSWRPVDEGTVPPVRYVSCRRFMLNQDTGGAITGPGRADMFWGSGPYAELAAGHLKHTGSLYLLVLNPAAAAP